MNDTVKIMGAIAGIFIFFVLGPAILILWLHDQYWNGAEMLGNIVCLIQGPRKSKGSVEAYCPKGRSS